MSLFKRLQNALRVAAGTEGIMTATAVLHVRHFDVNGVEIKKDRRVGRKCVTSAFVALLVDQLQSSSGEIALFKYHDSGTGTGNEAAGDTALGTPCEEARDTGTQTEGATANIYKSVATHTYAGSFAITEHGLFNAAESGTLMDRTKFAAVNVANGEKIGNGLPLAKVNGQYGVNCGNSKGEAYDNPQPSLMNGIIVVKKVHRLEVEQPSNKTSQAPRILCFA